MGLTWWQIALGVVIGLLILTILVVVHELGHAIAAVRNGVKVEEFGIGFPPLAKKLGQVKGVDVTLNWLPIGGFCRMKGETDDDKAKGTYGAASLWAKSKILLAGVGMNFITGCVIFTILAFIGIPQITPNQFAIASDNHGDKGVVSIYGVVDDSPAERAGLRKGDVIKSVDGQAVSMSVEVPQITAANAGQAIDIVIERDGKEQTVRADIASEDNGSGRLGIQTEQAQGGTIKATWSAPLVGIVDSVQFFGMTIKGLWDILVNLFQGLYNLVVGSPSATTELSAASDGVAGPIGILGQIFPSALVAGPAMLLYISGILSISLAVMNLLPIPGLDGGRLYLTLWYHARGKKLTKEREEKIVGWGMMLLFGLIILITVVDVIKVV